MSLFLHDLDVSLSLSSQPSLLLTQTFPTLASHVQHRLCQRRDKYRTCITGSIDAVGTG